MHPDFPTVDGVYQMTTEWSLETPVTLNRRIEEGNLVLWRPGFTIWIAVWGNDHNESADHRLAWIKKDTSADAFSNADSVEPNGVIKYSYRLDESRENGSVHAFYGFKIAENGHIQVAFYCDDRADVHVAEQIFGSISYRAAA